DKPGDCGRHDRLAQCRSSARRVENRPSVTGIDELEGIALPARGDEDGKESGTTCSWPAVLVAPIADPLDRPTRSTRLWNQNRCARGTAGAGTSSSGGGPGRRSHAVGRGRGIVVFRTLAAAGLAAPCAGKRQSRNDGTL